MRTIHSSVEFVSIMWKIENGDFFNSLSFAILFYYIAGLYGILTESGISSLT